MRRIGHAVILLAFVSVGGVASCALAEPIFPGVSTVGLKPPPGFLPKESDFRKGNALIAAVALSKAGYLRAAADRVHFAASQAGAHATIEPLGAGDGFLI